MNSLLKAQLEIRKTSELRWNKKRNVISYKIGEMYWHLPSMGIEGWVRGRILIAQDENTLCSMEINPATGMVDSYINVPAVKMAQRNAKQK